MEGSYEWTLKDAKNGHFNNLSWGQRQQSACLKNSLWNSLGCPVENDVLSGGDEAVLEADFLWIRLLELDANQKHSKMSAIGGIFNQADAEMEKETAPESSQFLDFWPLEQAVIHLHM